VSTLLWGSFAKKAEVAPRNALLPSTADVAKERDRLWAHWGEHPNNWLCGFDTTNPEGPKQLIWTTDERDQAEPVKPWPIEKEYLQRYVDDLHTHNYVLLDKCRQMLVSTATLLYLDHLCRFKDSRRCVLSKRSEDEAIEMLEDKVRAVHRRLPEWVRLRSRQTPRPMKKVKYLDTGSYILAANEVVAKGAARGGTASVLVIDEGAFQDMFGEIWSAAQPMCDKIFGITTASVTGRGARVYKLMLDEGTRLEEAA